MKRIYFILACILMAAPQLFAQTAAVQGFCSVGGVKVNTQGLLSNNTVLASYPKCSVIVYLTGTTNKATIYADGGGTPLGNPFTANANASWLFYAATSVGYDVVLSGGTPIAFPAPFTLTDLQVGGGGGGGGPTLQTNGTNNASQSTLNLVGGANVTVTNTSAGNVSIADTASGGTVGSPGTLQAAGTVAGTHAAATSTNVQNAIGAAVYVPSQAITNGPVTFFGTSVTEGVGSSINGNSYVDVLATDAANGLNNWGRGGDQAADMAEQVVRKFSKNSQFRSPLTINDPFINDANHCGNTAGCLANAAAALNAILGWELIPAQNTIYASAATSSGFAADTTTFGDPTLPTIGMSTQTQNSTLTFNLTNAGPEVGITFAACDAFTSAQFTVTLGGTLVDTISPIGNSGQTIATQNGATCTFFRREYANSSGATVSLVVKKTDAVTTTAGKVSIWAVDSNPTGAATGAPITWTEGTIMQDLDANSATTAAFDAQANTTATAFATDGWRSWYVPLRAGQPGANPGVNSTTHMANNPPTCPDENVGLHPNGGGITCGHFALAMTIENFGTANGMPYFNHGVSGGHNFFYRPIQGFLHFAPTSILDYNVFSADSTLSTTALNPGGILTNLYVSPSGALTFGGIDFGYDASISAFITRIFSSSGFVEMCPTGAGLVTLQSQFACGHDIFQSNGDYVKPFGFFRPKGGTSYENQFSAVSHNLATNNDRGANVNFINTSAGQSNWMLPLCKSNTYDAQLFYFKSTGDGNTVRFNAYNTLDSINGNTSTVTGTITAYSIVTSTITLTSTANPPVNSVVVLSGFPTSTFLNGIQVVVVTSSGTQFTGGIVHANASATESGSFQITASWTGLAAPYSAVLAQCSVGPTGPSTWTLAQFARGDTNAPISLKYVGSLTAAGAGTSDILTVTGLVGTNTCSMQATNSGASVLTGNYVVSGSGSATWNHSTAVGGETASIFCSVP